MEERGCHRSDHGQRILRFLRRLPPIQEQHIPPTLRLLDRRQQAQDLQRALGVERAVFQNAMGGLALRWEELRAQEAELRDYLLRFQRVIAENEVKRRQAVRKARSAREIYDQKERQLHVLQEERQSLARRKQKIQAQIQKYSKFCDYLEGSAVASEEFQDSCDVLSRFHTLVATSHYLQQVVQEAQVSIDQTKAQLSGFLGEKSDEAVQLHHQLGQLQANLEEAQNQRLLWESHWAHIQTMAAKKTLLLGTIKMASLNLFQSIDVPGRSGAVDDTVRQLETVQQYIQDLSDIYEATKRHCRMMTGAA
ncbi:coiled-coil domain-containing protein 42-like isoform X2 [Rhinoderma darwinii]|uniref:coiled-coil domain-containing protein 42-like isoform X2 n=1 Tax=Rhinoderma darwinii TaxID=43563 RepID=UPI003F6778F4